MSTYYIGNKNKRGINMNAEIKTNVIKRNGEEVAFDLEKIINAIKGANKDVDKLHRMNEYKIMAVADNVAKKIEE